MYNIYFFKIKSFSDRFFSFRNLFFLITIFSKAFFIETYAQEYCGTVQYNQDLKKKQIVLETNQQFEDWLKNTSNQKKQFKNLFRENTQINIPVVVHIIHNGEPVGRGTNLSVEQIKSQIEVLNEDFRRKNEDAINTPDDFLSVAADSEINFILAKRDPEGLSTSGIVRVDGKRDIWNPAQFPFMKQISYWPAEEYLNIWVTNMSSGFLGAAQFPVSSLSGVENASQNRLTDGIIIDYSVFGSIKKYPSANLKTQYSLGRTTTHEVGHFLGLRHIWGDGSCMEDDYCEDTPLQSRSHIGLNVCDYPNSNSCVDSPVDFSDMFQNYMDFTGDVCMNLFTKDQKNRMRTVLDNSPRRVSLKSSVGAVSPVFTKNDLGIKGLLNPVKSVCNDSFFSILEVRNYGTKIIHDFKIDLKVNGILVETYSSDIALNSLEVREITFDEIMVKDFSQDFILRFEIISINQMKDLVAENNVLETVITIPPSIDGLLAEDFDTESSFEWQVQNLDNQYTWEVQKLINEGFTNNAMVINYYDYELELGGIDYFSSPSFTLKGKKCAKLFFDLAYSSYSNSDQTHLTVMLAKNCGDPFSQSDTLFSKSANDLITYNNTLGFAPSSINDWRREYIDLSKYIKDENVQIIFVSTSNFYGNKLYIDNISVIEAEDEIIRPSIISCQNNQKLQIEVFNHTHNPIDNYTISYYIDDGEKKNFEIRLDNLLPIGGCHVFENQIGDLSFGKHHIGVEIFIPNSSKKQLDKTFFIDDTQKILPMRENMDDFENSKWLQISSNEINSWNTTKIGNKTAIVNNYSGQSFDENWLVSPIIDFSGIDFASLTFEIAYSAMAESNDELAIYLSTDCGLNFDHLVYRKSKNELSTSDFANLPSFNQWRYEIVDLNNFIGFSDVRLAFVTTKNSENSIFLDDFQIFLTDNVTKTTDIIYPNPTNNGVFFLQFDLKHKENVQVKLFDSTGEQLMIYQYYNILNQRYEVDINAFKQGVYFINIKGISFNITRRIIKK